MSTGVGKRGVLVAAAAVGLLCSTSCRPSVDTSEAGAGGWPEPLRQMAVDAEQEFQAPTVSVQAVMDLPEDVIVVDVRNLDESTVSQLAGAQLLSTDQQRAEFLASAPTQQVLVYCTAGWRSGDYTRQLVDAGITAWNLEGGICAWAVAGNELVDADGKPTLKIHSFNDDMKKCVPATHEAVVE